MSDFLHCAICSRPLVMCACRTVTSTKFSEDVKEAMFAAWRKNDPYRRIAELEAENQRLRESPVRECTGCESCFLEVLMRRDANGLLFCEACFAALERECEGLKG